MRPAVAFVGFMVGCGPGPTTPASVEPPSNPAQVDVVIASERHVVLLGGTPIFDSPDATRPRGWLGKDEHIGGWTMRLVDEVGARVHVRADLGTSFEHCAREVDGLRGLDVEIYVPKTALGTVITREVTLSATECDTIVAHTGVMVKALCEEDGVKRYRVGSCPNAECVYAVPDDAIGTSYIAGPRSEIATPSSAETSPMPCIDGVDDSGTPRPYSRDRPFGGLPATDVSRYTVAREDGKLPDCDLHSSVLFCDVRPRLGFDHVQYELSNGTKVTWRDGTAAGVAAASHRFRAVPRSDGDRMCWAAVEGESSGEDVVLCAAPDSIQRIEEAHGVVLQAREDGNRTRWFHADDVTRCYREALAKSPELAGRVHATFRVEKERTTLERVARPGDEAFGRCLAGRLDARGRERDPHLLELVIELYPALTGSEARRRAPADGSRPPRDRLPGDRHR